MSTITHGHARVNKHTSIYYTWVALRQRCNNPNNKQYNNYGGRGIKVCERWNSFENFLEDMGDRPKGLVIDRIDNEGDYTPNNCHWTTYKMSANNQRTRKNSRFITAHGKTQTIAEWAREIGVSYATIHLRLTKLFWPEELAVSSLDHRKRTASKI